MLLKVYSTDITALNWQSIWLYNTLVLLTSKIIMLLHCRLNMGIHICGIHCMECTLKYSIFIELSCNELTGTLVNLFVNMTMSTHMQESRKNSSVY